MPTAVRSLREKTQKQLILHIINSTCTPSFVYFRCVSYSESFKGCRRRGFKRTAEALRAYKHKKEILEALWLPTCSISRLNICLSKNNARRGGISDLYTISLSRLTFREQRTEAIELARRVIIVEAMSRDIPNEPFDTQRKR